MIRQVLGEGGSFLLILLRDMRHRRRVEKSVISNAFRPAEGTPFPPPSRVAKLYAVKRGRAAVRCMRLTRRTVQRVSSPT